MNIRDKFRYYFSWCKAAFCISGNLPFTAALFSNFFLMFFSGTAGLILGHGLVEHAVINIMMSYLTENWDISNLRIAVVIISAQEGFASVLMIVVAHSADAFFGRFNMVIFTSIAYIVGLVLLRLLNPATNSGIYCIVAVLLAIGKAGKEPPLKAFLADQLSNNNNVNNNNESLDKNKERVVARTQMWWRISRFIGTLIATFVLGEQDWNLVFLISAIVMACSLLFFLLGFSNYCRIKPSISPLTTVFLVIKAAFKKRSLSYSSKPEDYSENDGEQLPLTPDTLFTRWLDRAALIEKTSLLSIEGQEKKWEICTVKQVKEVKFLIEMLPMWATFVTYCLVQATGSTFFYDQSSDLDHSMGNFEAPTIFLYLIQSFSNHAISWLSDKIISKWFNESKKKLRAMKWRIGIGMACSFLCCVVARVVEIKRLHKVKNKEYHFVDQTIIIDMSVFWLAPQFCLLGLGEGLTEDGLVQFFYYQVSESMESYGVPFNEFVLGIGKFISVFWVLTFRSWIGRSLYDSRLDNYYGILAICSLGNLVIIYGYVSKNFYKDARKLENSLEESLAQIVKVEEKINTTM